MVAAGMTIAEVIEAATSRPADLLGRDDIGSLAPGKSADFIVLNASPLDDIANLHSVDDVYMRGERLDRQAMRTRFIGR